MKRRALHEAGDLLAERAGGPLECAIVLGSGIGAAFDQRLTGTGVDYDDIPGMPEPTVQGHLGRVLVGALAGRRVAAFSGRFHLYEGYEPRDVTTPVAVAAAAGARTIILTNAAGGLNADFASGDLMLIADHLNLTGRNPLAEPRSLHDVKQRFVDLGDAYARELRELAKRAGEDDGIALRSGVYAGVPGPSYETSAEAAMLRTCGADAVGMSTVLETIAARALDMRVLGISVITNVVGTPTTHQEVLDRSTEASTRLALLVERILASPEFTSRQ